MDEQKSKTTGDRARARDAKRAASERGVQRNARQHLIGRARARYLQTDLSIDDVADIFGISHYTLRNIASREGWTAARTEARREAIRQSAAAAAGAMAARYDRLVTVCDRAIDAAAEGIDSGAYTDTARSLREAAQALLALRDTMGLQSPAAQAEQDARISKLRAETDAIAHKDDRPVIKVELAAPLEALTD